MQTNNQKTIGEYVSPGHPDKVCDAIAGNIVDLAISRNPEARVGIEVMAKADSVYVVGEVSANLGEHADGMAPADDDFIKLIPEAVKCAYASIGYDSEYSARMPAGVHTPAHSLKVFTNVTRQSADIAVGVDRNAWGDQGIFSGIAFRDCPGQMPPEMYYARLLGETLYINVIDGWIKNAGIDIKTLAICENGKPVEAVIAMPDFSDDGSVREAAVNVAHNLLGIDEADIVFNGTGRFTYHGILADSGLTGRKLAVDLYGLSCPIGGGSPHGKDWTKADVALPLYARYLAKNCVNNSPLIYKDGICRVDCACAIGRQEVTFQTYDGHGNPVETWVELLTPARVCEILHLDEPRYMRRALKLLD